MTSTGEFLLRRQGDQVLVTGTITHLWTDPGYNFDPSDPFFEEAQVLERHKKAKPFSWKAEWIDIITGELEIIEPFTPNASRRRISFETNTIVM